MNSSPSFLRRRLCALVFVAALGASSSASDEARAADPQEQKQQVAQALFDEGRALMARNRYAEACPKLAESQRLDPGGGTLLNLAICHEKEGKLATAKIDLEGALALALKDGRKDRQQMARERLDAIEPIIPRIRILVAVAPPADGLEVRLDGVVVRRESWGVALYVNPGAHVVEATAPNRARWSTSVAIKASQKTNVDVPPLAGIAPAPPR